MLILVNDTCQTCVLSLLLFKASTIKCLPGRDDDCLVAYVFACTPGGSASLQAVPFYIKSYLMLHSFLGPVNGLSPLELMSQYCDVVTEKASW